LHRVSPPAQSAAHPSRSSRFSGWGNRPWDADDRHEPCAASLCESEVGMNRGDRHLLGAFLGLLALTAMVMMPSASAQTGPRPRQLGVGPSRYSDLRDGYLSSITYFVVRGGYLYTASQPAPVVATGGSAIFDVSDPTAVKQVGFYDTFDRGVLDVALVGPYLY